jgi:hypothetical protein
VSAADRFKKRPDTLKHRFPSQDIWEDTPNSLQLLLGALAFQDVGCHLMRVDLAVLHPTRGLLLGCEPLFPEDDAKKETVSAADRFKKRPDTLKHRFPSQVSTGNWPCALVDRLLDRLWILGVRLRLSSSKLPRFPEDDAKKETVSAADRFKKRPDTLKHRFPSQDIWERES